MLPHIEQEKIIMYWKPHLRINVGHTQIIVYIYSSEGIVMKKKFKSISGRKCDRVHMTIEEERLK